MKVNQNWAKLFATLTAMSAATFSAAQSAEQGGLEEVVVTAQKRAENLQTTPIAITALTANTIKELGITNNKALFGVVPGLQGFEPPSSRGNLSLNIRGVPSGNANSVSNDPASALYIDGVYVPKGFGVGVDLVDLERIEVLRGPQGTLYGRNTTGGAVNFVSRKPSGELSINAKVGTGNYNLRDYKITADLPAVGALSTTLSYFKRERDPLYGNTNPSLKGEESLNRQGWRVAFELKPTESLTASYSFIHSELSELSQALQPVGLTPNAGTVAAQPGYPTNVPINSTSRSATLATIQTNLAFLGAAAATPQVKQLSQWITDYRNWEANMYATAGSRPSSISGDIPLSSSNDVDAQSLTLSWRVQDLGAFGDVEFKSVTGLRKVRNINQGDLDGMDNTVRPLGNGLTSGVLHDVVLSTIGGLFFGQVPGFPAASQFTVGRGLVDAINALGRAPAFTNYADTQFEARQEELSMIGKSGNLDYVLGLFLYKDEGKFRNNRWALFPISASDTTSHDNGTSSKAFYTQGTWRESQENPFSFTAGLRHTRETKDVTYLHRSGAGLAGFFTPLLVPGTTYSSFYFADAASETQNPVANVFGKSFSHDFSNTSGKLTLGYDVNRDVHSYVTYSTGYKSGTFNGDFYDTANNTGDLLRPEKMKNIEAGVKADVSSRLRVNASWFRYVYEDMHVSSLYVRPNGSVVSRIQNAGRATRYGGEIEVAFQPIDSVVTSLSWSGIRGTFDQFPDPKNATKSIANSVDYAKRGLSPNNQVAANIDWRIAKTPMGVLTANLNGNWQSETFAIAMSSDNYASGPVIFQQPPNEARGLVNARLSLSEIPAGDSKLRISAWGRNLGDKQYHEFSFGYGASLGLNLVQYGEPRTYGVDFEVLFGGK